MMVITELLFVGEGPDPETEETLYGRTVVRVATARQAYDVIDAGNVAIVPTTDVAKHALFLLGATPEWARLAVFEDRNIQW